MDIQRLDLNLLLVFHQMLRLQRVSAVAQAMGMSQPAVSSALGRLRQSLGDELFLRTPAGMAPTPYALQLAAPVAQALDGLQQALHVRASFDPAHSRRDFTLAMTDVGEMYFLPCLVDMLARTAPGVTVQVVGVAPQGLREDMAAGQIDLALGLLPQLQAGYYQQALFRQPYVGLMRRQHPLARRRALSLSDLAQAEHVRVLAAGTGHGRVDRQLQKLGIERKIRLTLPHYVALGDVLRQSDWLAIVPERFAQSVTAPFELVARALPMDLGESAIHQFWHGRLHRDPGHQWLRAQVAQLFGEGVGGAPEARA